MPEAKRRNAKHGADTLDGVSGGRFNRKGEPTL